MNRSHQAGTLSSRLHRMRIRASAGLLWVIAGALLFSGCQQPQPRHTTPAVKADDTSLFLLKPRDEKSLCARPFKPNRKRFRSISAKQKSIMKKGYLLEIASKLKGSWHSPTDVAGAAQCHVLIMQRPDGCIRSTKFLDCPNTQMRRSVISALRSTSPFPAPPHPSVYVDKIRFTFTK